MVAQIITILALLQKVIQLHSDPLIPTYWRQPNTFSPSSLFDICSDQKKGDDTCLVIQSEDSKGAHKRVIFKSILTQWSIILKSNLTGTIDTMQWSWTGRCFLKVFYISHTKTWNHGFLFSNTSFFLKTVFFNKTISSIST